MGDRNRRELSAVRLAEVLKALADDTRLHMLLALSAEPEVCGCEFEARLGITQSKSSRHLRYMRSAGLVKDRREGVWVHYRLSEDMEPRLREAITALLATLSAEDRAAAARRDGAVCCGAPQENTAHAVSCEERSHV